MQVENEPRSPRRERDSLSTLSLSDLVDACRAESARFLAGSGSDGECGKEVFRRAICERDENSWTALLDMYRGLLLRQLNRHPCREQVEDEPDVCINRAWARFWTAIPAERFGSFPDLASVLRYLKLCLHSVIMDAARANQRVRQEPLEAAERQGAADDDQEEAVLGSLAGAELWRAIVAELDGEQEYIVATLSFVRGLKPKQVQARRPEHFHDVAEVYRVKRNILDRLRQHLRGEYGLVRAPRRRGPCRATTRTTPYDASRAEAWFSDGQ